MEFKVGDKVIINPPDWYGGTIKPNEKCVVTKTKCSPHVIWVRNTNGIKAAIYENWASKIIKGQQLLFNFMEK